MKLKVADRCSTSLCDRSVGDDWAKTAVNSGGVDFVAR
jgi:hypothetical protein